MALRMLFDMVLLEPTEAQQQVGDIILPSRSAKDTNEGMVVAHGLGSVDNDGNHRTPEVHVGDRVIFNRNRAMEFEDEGRKLLILNMHEVLAVFEDDDSVDG